jgi:hypothetical protein
MRMLNKFLKLTPPQPGDTSAARAKLRASHAERAGAKVQTAKAKDRAEALRGIIDSVAPAEAEVQRLEAEVTQAGIDWLSSGGDAATEPPLERKLLAELREARLLVEERQRRAQGAEAVFGVDVWSQSLGRTIRQDITADEVAAQDSLKDAEGAVKETIRDVMLADVEADLQRLQVLRDEFVPLFSRVRGLDTALGGAGNYSSFAGDRGALEKRLRAVSISCELVNDVDSRAQRSRDIYAESEPWTKFGRALASDADAAAPPA